MTVTSPGLPQRLRTMLPQRRVVAAGGASTQPWVTPSVVVALTVSLLAAWFALYATVLSGLQASRDNASLYKQFRANLAQATVPIGQPIAPGTPIALLKLPEVGLSNEVVVEGTSPDELMQGVGHLRTSPLPGQPGMSQIFGRSLTYGAPFGDIDQLKKGARFTVTTGQGTFHYVVARVRHVGDPVPPPLPVGGSGLMLETSIGTLLSSLRPVYVDATLTDKPVPAATAPLATVPKSERALGTDHAHLAQLVFWLQGLFLAAVLTTWGVLRWGRWQAWLVGVPLVLTMLWGATGAATRLLPNLI